MLQYSRRHGRKSGTVDAQPLTQHQRIENNIRSLERKNLELQAKVKELLRKAGDKQHYTTRKRREFLMEARPYINRKAKNINLIRKFRRLQDRLLHARLKSLRSRARLYAETVVGLLSDPMTLEKDVASDSAMPPRRTERAIIDVALGLASIRYLELDEALEIAPSGAPSDAHIAGTLIAHASAVAGIESPSATHSAAGKTLCDALGESWSDYHDKLLLAGSARVSRSRPIDVDELTNVMTHNMMAMTTMPRHHQ